MIANDRIEDAIDTARDLADEARHLRDDARLLLTKHHALREFHWRAVERSREAIAYSKMWLAKSN